MRRNRIGRWRLAIQFLSAAFLNGYAKGFVDGTIFKGKSKSVCVPVLNCYSCPGALGACPIGSLQSDIGQKRIPFYVLGSMMLFGILLGRVVCGFLCPFGLLQDLLHKIPTPKRKIPQRAHKVLCKVKYLVLASFVILFPLLAAVDEGAVIPFFCKYFCPAGTLEGGVMLAATNRVIRRLLGALFSWKLLVLLVIVLLSVVIHRPFCRYLCPLGAFYGLFHKMSFFQLTLDEDACVKCGKCEEVCPMQVDILKNIQSAECIHCGACREKCPTGAIKRKK